MRIINSIRQLFRTKPEPTLEEQAAINRLREHLRGPLHDDDRKECERAIVEFHERYGLPRPNLSSPY